MKHFIRVEVSQIVVDIDKKVFNKTFDCNLFNLSVEVDEWKKMVEKNEYFRVCYDEYREFRVFDVDGNELEFDY